MRKTTMILAGAAGYVLGAKAGHERYEQIKSAAQKVTRDPRVQRRAQQAQTVVKEKAADTMHTATSKMHSSDSQSPTVV
jgi:hypothetical protein